MMDDVGAFIWRYGKRLLTSGAEPEGPAATIHPPQSIARLPEAE